MYCFIQVAFQDRAQKAEIIIDPWDVGGSLGSEGQLLIPGMWEDLWAQRGVWEEVYQQVVRQWVQ